MVLPENVVEVLNLAHKDRHVATGVDRINGGLVRAALVNRDPVRIAVRSNGLVKKALRRQQEVDGLALLVDGAVQIFQTPLNLMYVSPMRQLLPTGRLCLRAIFSISGKNRIAHRLIVEWSTDTPRFSIIFSRCR
jgi:hypothetical protein